MMMVEQASASEGWHIFDQDSALHFLYGYLHEFVGTEFRSLA